MNNCIDKRTLLLDEFHSNIPKCRLCNGHILYPNTTVTAKNIIGTSYKTIKRIGDDTYHLSICHQCLVQKFPKYSYIRAPFNCMCEATKFAFNIPIDQFLEYRKTYAMTEQKMIKKYGEEEGTKRWNEYVEKQRLTNTFEYKRQIYGWDRTDFDNFNKSRAVTIKNLIKRYGEEEGTKRWNEYVEKQRLTKSWEYMVKSYGEERARAINKSKAITKQNLINKYGEEEGIKRWNTHISNLHLHYSKLSQKCFKELDLFFPGLRTEYASKNNERIIQTSNGIYMLDYYIPELNVCIEFNGDSFQGNPHIFDPDDHCHPFDKSITAKDLQLKDKIRIDTLKNEFNIKTYIIWEFDYKQNNIKLDEFAQFIKQTNDPNYINSL